MFGREAWHNGIAHHPQDYVFVHQSIEKEFLEQLKLDSTITYNYSTAQINPNQPSGCSAAHGHFFACATLGAWQPKTKSLNLDFKSAYCTCTVYIHWISLQKKKSIEDS